MATRKVMELERKGDDYVNIRGLNCSIGATGNFDCKLSDKSKPGKHMSVHQEEIRDIDDIDAQDAGLEGRGFSKHRIKLYNTELNPWRCSMSEKGDKRRLNCKTQDGEVVSDQVREADDVVSDEVFEVKSEQQHPF